MHVLWPMPSSITTISTFRVARIERSSVSNAGLRPASDGDGSCSPPGHFYYLDSTSYAPMIYCEDVYQDVFRKTLAGDESLTETDITMQRLYVDLLKSGYVYISNVRGLHSAVDDCAFFTLGAVMESPNRCGQLPSTVRLSLSCTMRSS